MEKVVGKYKLGKTQVIEYFACGVTSFGLIGEEGKVMCVSPERSHRLFSSTRFKNAYPSEGILPYMIGYWFGRNKYHKVVIKCQTIGG